MDDLVDGARMLLEIELQLSLMLEPNRPYREPCTNLIPCLHAFLFACLPACRWSFAPEAEVQNL